MKITIIFATYNGAKRLEKMLSALREIEYPAENWDIIAVDNNSTDDTFDALKSYKDKLPLTVLSEEQKGKSHAMNKGLDHVKPDTDLVILTDDDIIAGPHWLSELARAAAQHPDHNIFGGEIRPHWEIEPPEWVLQWVNVSMVFAINEGHKDDEINPEMVFGPNSAFRADLFTKENIRFPLNIGPKSGGSYPMGNDTILVQLLAEKGNKAWHVPSAIVQHMIPKSHIDEQWIIGRAERYGWGRVILHPEWFKNYDKISFAWAKKFIKFCAFSVLFFPFKHMPRSHLRYKFLYSYYYQKGIIKGLLQNLKQD